MGKKLESSRDKGRNLLKEIKQDPIIQVSPDWSRLMTGIKDWFKKRITSIFRTKPLAQFSIEIKASPRGSSRKSQGEEYYKKPRRRKPRLRSNTVRPAEWLEE